uniref:Uncharacterized protein n=1 Tax=Cucumis melo TaxID=3656 RepID=A0A9I9EBQ7_CUCME
MLLITKGECVWNMKSKFLEALTIFGWVILMLHYDDYGRSLMLLRGGELTEQQGNSSYEGDGHSGFLVLHYVGGSSMTLINESESSENFPTFMCFSPSVLILYGYLGFGINVTTDFCSSIGLDVEDELEMRGDMEYGYTNMFNLFY